MRRDHVLHRVEVGTHFWVTFRRAVRAMTVLLAIFAASFAAAQEPGRKDGLFLTVPNPIEGKTAEVLRKKIVDAVEKQGRVIEMVVFDFNPDDLPAGSSTFGA